MHTFHIHNTHTRHLYFLYFFWVIRSIYDNQQRINPKRHLLNKAYSLVTMWFFFSFLSIILPSPPSLCLFFYQLPVTPSPPQHFHASYPFVNIYL
ncbi:hypothetical protein BDC45DRAFT_203493 [Circinella umbellata]|nr:hypothetical protein BDC45DRAFT_203493 [Circinella umbellata]